MKWISLITTIFTWPLISFGAFVRLKGAGLACPDWPLCYGKIVPPEGYGIALEVGHRFIATVVGLLIIALVIGTFRDKKLNSLRSFSIILFLLVAFQGVLGGLTVLMKLEPYIVTSHLIGGNILFAGLIIFTYNLFLPALEQNTKFNIESSKTIIVFSSIFFVMLISGGYNSTTYSGYACYSFPECLPDQTLFQVEGKSQLIHMLHRLIVIVGGGILLYGLPREIFKSKDSFFNKILIAIIILIVAEITLGIINAMYHVPVPVSTLHTAIASTITGLFALAFSRKYYVAT